MPKTARQKRALQLKRHAEYNARQATRRMPPEVKAIPKGEEVERHCFVRLNRLQNLHFHVVIKKYNDGTWDARTTFLTLAKGYDWEYIRPPPSTNDIELESPQRVFNVAADIVDKLHTSGVALSAPAEKVYDIANAILGPDGETIVPPGHPCLALRD